MPKSRKLPKRAFIFPTKGKTARYPYSLDYHQGGRMITKHFPTQKPADNAGQKLFASSKKAGKTSFRYGVRKRTTWTGGA